MFNARLIFFVAALGMLLAACASFGPLERGQFEARLRKDIHVSDDTLIFYSPAVILPGVIGYEMPGVLMASKVKAAGVLILGSENIYFVLWNEEKYEDYWRLSYKDVEKLDLRSLGFGRRIVIRYENESKVESIDVTGDSGQFIDREKTESVCKVFEQRSGKACIRT
jgi:hypothetical protein